MADIPMSIQDRELQKFVNCPPDSGQVAVRNKICSSASDPVYVTIVDGDLASSNPIFFDDQRDSNNGVEQSIFNLIVPAATTYMISKLYVNCRLRSKWRLELNGSIIASGGTGAGFIKDEFSWVPQRNAVAGDNIELIIEVFNGQPIDSVSSHLMAYAIT